MGLRTVLNLLLLLAASTNSLPHEEDRLSLSWREQKAFPGPASITTMLKTTILSNKDTTLEQAPETTEDTTMELSTETTEDTTMEQSTEPADVTCPGFYEAHGGLCLFFAAFNKVSHKAAPSTCSSFNNGYLAVIDDSQKLDSIILTIKAKGLDGNDFWIDGSNSEGNWTYKDKLPFVNGTPFWAASESFHAPQLDGENCAALTSRYDYLISDEDCTDLLFPLCQANPVTTLNVKYVTRDVECPQSFVLVSGSCLGFLIWTAPESWSEAKFTCESMGGTLYASNDIKMLRSVYEYLHEQDIQSHSFWIGGTDMDVEGNWTWSGTIPITMGTPFWGIADPGNDTDEDPSDPKVEPDGGVKENCLALTAAGMHYFRDKDCTTKYNPLCMAQPLS